jgi:hypothetical protein
MTLLPAERRWIDDAAGHGRRGGGERRREERSAPGALPPLEVAVARADGVLPGAELIAVHRDAHRAARLAPLGAGVAEHDVEPLGLGLLLDRFEPGTTSTARPRRPCGP